MQIYIYRDRFFITAKPDQLLRQLREYALKYRTVKEMLALSIH